MPHTPSGSTGVAHLQPRRVPLFDPHGQLVHEGGATFPPLCASSLESRISGNVRAHQPAFQTAEQTHVQRNARVPENVHWANPEKTHQPIKPTPPRDRWPIQEALAGN